MMLPPEEKFALPQEMSDGIQHSMYELVFGPRTNFPHIDASNAHHFCALDRKLHVKYHQMFYSRNMWMIGEGPAQYTLDFLQNMSDHLVQRIKRTNLRWTTKDLIQGGELFSFIEGQVERGGNRGLV